MRGQKSEVGKAETVASLTEEFGKALKGGWVVDGDAEYAKLPFTVECRAKLDGKKGYNILVASEMKSSATHWELYTHAGRGTLADDTPPTKPEDAVKAFKTRSDVASDLVLQEPEVCQPLQQSFGPLAMPFLQR